MMRRVSFSEWKTHRDTYDDAVCRTPHLPSFTSSATWCLAAREHLLGLGDGDSEGEEQDSETPEQALRLPTAAIKGDTAIWRDEDGSNWLVFGRSPWGYWQPFEAAWMFDCPLIGPDPAALLDQLRHLVEEDPDLTPGFAFGGIPRDQQLHQALSRLNDEGGFRRYQEFPALDSLVIDLDDSQCADDWLGRRSKKFRRSLKTAARRCQESGLEIEEISAEKTVGDDAFDRILELQPYTSKWTGGADIFQSDRYRKFYRQIFRDLRDSGRLRLLFATREGDDFAYIFGGVFGGEYRGLQMSYISEIAPLGAGNWLQWENLHRRASEGVGIYDLGMESEYKLRWADRRRTQAIAFAVF